MGGFYPLGQEKRLHCCDYVTLLHDVVLRGAQSWKCIKILLSNLKELAVIHIPTPSLLPGLESADHGEEEKPQLIFTLSANV
jgi:hypothetical protein